MIDMFSNLSDRLKGWVAWQLGIISPSRLLIDKEYAQKVAKRRQKAGQPDDLIAYVEEALVAHQMNSSPQQIITDILKRDKSTDEILEWMTREGQSVVLNWGEDNGMWECDFINGRGKRFSSVAYPLRKAIRECIMQMAWIELGMPARQFWKD